MLMGGSQSRQQSSFLTKANHKSLNSNQLANSKDQATNSKEMQRILQKFFKEASKKAQGGQGQVPGQQ